MTNTYVSSMVVADLNADSKLDIVAVGPAASDSVAVLLGSGTGSFALLTKYNLSYAYAIVAGDFNKDGAADLAIGNSIESITILFGWGNGAFIIGDSYVLGGSVDCLAAGDLNRDGRLDLVAATSSMSSLSFLQGLPAGYFGPIVSNYLSGAVAESMMLADLDKDGALDVLTTHSKPRKLSMFFGNGAGGISRQTDLPLGFTAYGADVADLNGDENLDVVAVKKEYNTACFVVPLLGNGTGNFVATTPIYINASPSPVRIADVNGDGRPDVLGQLTSSTGSFALLFNSSAPILNAKRLANRLELSWPNWSGYQLQVSTNLGSSAVWVPATNAVGVAGSRRFATNSTAGAQLFRLAQ